MKWNAFWSIRIGCGRRAVVLLLVMFFHLLRVRADSVVDLKPAGNPAAAIARLLRGEFEWRTTGPLLSAAQRAEDPCYSVKDPSIVYYEKRWHLFCTIRSQKRTHQIEYLSFADWKDASTAPRHILSITNGYFCAPEVFYFSPQRKWYLIYQIQDGDRKMLQPAYSTSTNIAEPRSWSAPARLYEQHPDNVKAWIDFWVICDSAKAHLFFTSNNGLMWRAETKLENFPAGWNKPAVVLRDDIFEASHTYRLKAVPLRSIQRGDGAGIDGGVRQIADLAAGNHYLTLVEAQAGSRRYYKAYLAEQLDGEWKPLAATRQNPFASAQNVMDGGEHWADSISHGELIRAGYDENLEVDPLRLSFLFQGVRDQAQAGKTYGEIPWRLGILIPIADDSVPAEKSK